MARAGDLGRLFGILEEVSKGLAGRAGGALALAVAAGLATTPAGASPRLEALHASRHAIKADSDDPASLIGAGAFLGAMRMLRPGPRVTSITLTVDVNVGYNLYTQAGSPTSPVSVVLIVSSGVKVRAALATGFLTGSGWAAGSTILIVNNGYIHGDGGSGGNAGQVGGTLNGANGAAGYDAIGLSWAVTIDNTNGYILAGAGGGGGGAAYQLGLAAAGGGSGGGGQGTSTGPGNVGGTNAGTQGGVGSFNGPGARGNGGSDSFYGVFGGDGGAGGVWATAGAPGQATATNTAGNGGAPGYAIRLNGYSVTWVGGYNSTQVQGAVA